MGYIDYDGRNNVYTYMAWQLITDPTSKQYELREDAGMNFDSEGFGDINGCYVIACTTHYGEVGDYIDWVLADGSTLRTIIGDIKSSGDSNWTEYGHVYGNSLNVIEFVVDYDTWYNGHPNPGNPSCHPEWAGLIQSYENVGNYWTGVLPVGNETFYIVKGYRYSMSGNYNVMYIASRQGDNHLYFNDENFFRIRPDGSGLQVYYLDKQNWINSSLITDISVGTFRVSSSNSGGTVSTNAKVERAVIWMIDKVTNEYITYSRLYRNLKDPYGSSYDCSSFVITGFYMGGLDADATYTGNMKAAFEDLGFTWIPGSYFDSADCVRGDILLKQFNPGGHTQVYIGNNQDINCGSTPAGVQSHAPDNYGRGWDGLLRLV